ncbi:hypothetical protein ACWCQW_42230 [Streptomyces mirabilis]
MSEQPEADASLNELRDGLKEIREAQQRREGDLKTLHEELREGLSRTQSELGQVKAELTDFRSRYERDRAVLAAQCELDRITEDW